jgi:hypothetical protein
MKSIITAVAIVLGLLSAIWWGTALPHYSPTQATTTQQQREAQCPSNSRLEGKLCVCPEGTGWNGAHCVGQQVGMHPCPDDSAPYQLASSGAKPSDVFIPQPGNMIWMHDTPGNRRALGIVETVTENTLTVITTNTATGAMMRRSASGATVLDAACQLKIVGRYQP